MTKSQIHCPDCQTGYLRVLSDEELMKMFPLSRAANCVRNPEITRDRIIYDMRGNVHDIWGKPKRIGVYCDMCGHFHDMDERSLRQARKPHTTNKPKSVKIKGYGKYHR